MMRTKSHINAEASIGDFNASEVSFRECISYGFFEPYEPQIARNNEKICKHIFLVLHSQFGLIV